MCSAQTLRANLLQIHSLNVYQPMTQHIHGSRRLLEHDITDQRFIDAVFRRHIQKQHLVIYGTETLLYRSLIRKPWCDPSRILSFRIR